MASDLLHHDFYHNTLLAWLIAAALFAVIATLLFVVRGIVARRIARVATRTSTRFDDILVDLLRETRAYFVVIIAATAASLTLVLPTQAAQTIHVLAVIAIALQAGVWGNGVVASLLNSYAARRAAEGEATSAATVQAFGALARIFVWVLIAIVTVDNLGYKVGTLITGLGITGIAVALAVQSTLGDLFGALSIVVDKPFVIGDAIAVDDFVGTVEYIGLKTTRLKSISGEQLIFSNSDLLKSRIKNFRRQSERRVVFTTRVLQDTPEPLAARIPGMIREIVSARAQVRFDRSHLIAIGGGSLDYETVYMVTTADYQTYMDGQQAILLELMQRFEREGIELAVPVSMRIEPEKASE
jgi:small-conductance mechanosensitive channel